MQLDFISYFHEESNLRTFGPDLVAVIQDYGDKALIKVLKSSRYKVGAKLEIPHNQLKKQFIAPTPAQSTPYDPTACPHCKTPGQVDGIPCPGC